MNTPDAITVGTRKSQLARWQTSHVIERLQAAWPGISCRTQSFSTEGDRTLDRPLPAIGGKGLFTAALEDALRSGEIDIAVHSLKDLPVDDPPGLTVGAILNRADVRDVLVSSQGYSLQTLPDGAIVGTSSLRRQAQLLAVRPDLDVRSIRGNVETRIYKVVEGEYDATVLAAAGLARLELNEHPREPLSTVDMLPAPGQGALAVQCRAGDEATLSLLAALNDAAVRAAVTAERSFLKALGGGCAVPVAAYAVPDNGGYHLEGLVADPGGYPVVRVAGSGSDPLRLGQELAEQATMAGAGRILDHVKPLRNRRIVVTRSAQQAALFAERLGVLGAEPILFPVITFEPLDSGGFQEKLQAMNAYNWVIFTSANAVRFFFEALDQLEKTPSLPKIAAIGQGTAEALTGHGQMADFIPTVFSGEALAAELGPLDGQRVLLPRARAGRPETAQALVEQGAVVDDVPLYETVAAVPSQDALAEIKHGVDTVTFTSPSSVRNFVQLLQQNNIDAGRLLSEAQTICIGPSTAAELEAFGKVPDLVPSTYTVDGMIEAMLEKKINN